MTELRGKVIKEGGGPSHVCGPGWVWHERDPEASFQSLPSGFYWKDPHDVALGLTIECECGQTWVCKWQRGFVSSSGHGKNRRRAVTMAHKVWAKEGRIAKWLRTHKLSK